MDKKYIPNVKFDDAHVIWKNFEGRDERGYNKDHKRTFNIVINNPKAIQRMLDDGWNLKMLKPRDEEEEQNPSYALPVEVKYDSDHEWMNPTIEMITRTAHTVVSEDNVGLLDHAHIGKWNIVVRPYPWNVNGRSGIKAYLNKIEAFVEEDYISYDEDDDLDTPGALPFN